MSSVYIGVVSRAPLPITGANGSTTVGGGAIGSLTVGNNAATCAGDSARGITTAGGRIKSADTKTVDLDPVPLLPSTCPENLCSGECLYGSFVRGVRVVVVVTAAAVALGGRIMTGGSGPSSVTPPGLEVFGPSGGDRRGVPIRSVTVRGSSG